MVLWQFAAQTMPTVPNSFIAFKMVLGLLRASESSIWILCLVHLHQVGCPVCRNYSRHQKQNGRIQLNKTVLTFFIFFCHGFKVLIQEFMLLLQNMLLKIFLESHRFFLYVTTIKNIFSKVCPPSIFKQQQLSDSTSLTFQREGSLRPTKSIF